MSQVKPLLLLDVDGPLNPYKCITSKSFIAPKTRAGEEKFTWDRHIMYPSGWEEKGLPVLLSKDMGLHLRKLEEVFTLIWATTWREDANKWISPAIGLGRLPVIDFINDGTEFNWTLSPRHKGSWKTKWIARWLDDFAWYKSEGELKRIPWVFVDDDINREDRSFLIDHWNEEGKALVNQVAPRWLFRIEPSRGLTSKDFEDLYDWGLKRQLS